MVIPVILVTHRCCTTLHERCVYSADDGASSVIYGYHVITIANARQHQPTQCTNAPLSMESHQDRLMAPLLEADASRTREIYEFARFTDKIPVPDERLFNIHATADDLFEDVAQILPHFDLSHPCIQAFRQPLERDMSMAQPPYFPRQERNPTTWPLTNPQMNVDWLRAVQGEKNLGLVQEDLHPALRR